MPVLKNAKHELFAQAIAKGQTADQAYQSAGFKPNRGNASTLKAKQNIQERVKEIVEGAADRAEIDIARTLKELVCIGTSDIRKLFDENGNLLPICELDDATAAALASVEVVVANRRNAGHDVSVHDDLEEQGHGGALVRRRGEVEHIHKIKLWDKNSALEKIAKHLGMFVERVEHGVSDPLAKLLREVSGRSFRPNEGHDGG